MEPTNALADAASGEGDAGAPLDAKQLWKIAETGNHFFFCLFYTVIHTSRASVVLCVCVCVCVCVCSSIDADTGKSEFFIYGLDVWFTH